MDLTDTLNFVRGYVTVRITGRRPERFINMALQKNIYLWDVQKKEKEIYFKVSVKGFFLLRSVAFKTHTRVKIINKKGLFRYVNKVKGRKILALSGLLAFAALIFLSSLVLKIDVVGNEIISDKKIIEKLNEIDLKKFTLRSNIDIDKISSSLINSFDMIAWVGVYENGTHVTIDIRERVKPPKIVPKNIPCDLVAVRDGVIEKMTVENGEKAIELGQTALKGQVLVSGTLPIKNSEEKRYVHSMGSVIARTWYEKSADCKLYTYEKKYTGKKMRKTLFKFFSQEYISDRIIPYFNYDEKVKRRVIGFAEFNTITYSEYTLQKKPVSEEKAVAAVKQELQTELKRTIAEGAINEIAYEVTYKDEETRRIRAVARCTEEIAGKKEIKVWQNEQSTPDQPKE